MNSLLSSVKIPSKIIKKNEDAKVNMNGRILNEDEYSVSSAGVITVYKIEQGAITITYNDLSNDKFKKFLGSNYYNPRKKPK